MARAVAVVTLSLQAAGTSVWSAQWDITPRFHARELYSDNITLAANDAQSDFVTELTPGISVRGAGSRLRLSTDYNFQNLIYAKDGDRTSQNHQLQSSTTAELWKDIFFLDARALMTQQLIDNAGRISNSNISITGNRTDALIYGFSPYARHHFGAYADMEVRYNYDKISNDSASRTSSTSDTYSYILTSGRWFRRAPWSLSFDDSKVDYESGRTAEFKVFTATGSYVLTRQYRADVTVGYDEHTYATLRRDSAGAFWTVGGAWTPSVRTELAAGVGERFFGSTFYVRARHDHRRLQFRANYQENPQTTSRAQAQQVIIPLVDENGNPIFDPDLSNEFPLDSDGTALTDEVYIQKRLNASLGYIRPRDVFRLTGTSDSRTFETRAVSESLIGMTFSWRHQFSRRLFGGVRGNWHQTTFDATSRTDERISASPYLAYDLGPSIDVRMEYLYYDNSSDDPRNAYTENRLSAILNVHL